MRFSLRSVGLLVAIVAALLAMSRQRQEISALRDSLSWQAEVAEHWEVRAAWWRENAKRGYERLGDMEPFEIQTEEEALLDRNVAKPPATLVTPEPWY